MSPTVLRIIFVVIFQYNTVNVITLSNGDYQEYTDETPLSGNTDYKPVSRTERLHQFRIKKGLWQ